MNKLNLKEKIVAAFLKNEHFELSEDDIETGNHLSVFVPKYNFAFYWTDAEDFWDVECVVENATDKLYLSGSFQKATQEKIRDLSLQLRELTKEYLSLKNVVEELTKDKNTERTREFSDKYFY